MKICIISDLYNPYVDGGADITMERLAKSLKDKKYNVFVVTTKPFTDFFSLFLNQEIRDGVKVYRFYPLNLFHVYFIHKRRIATFIKILWRIIDLFNIHTFFLVLYIFKKEKPDIIHTGNLGGLSFSVFWAAKFLHIPLIHTLHNYHLLCPYGGELMCPYTKFHLCEKRPFPCLIYSFFKKIIVDSIPKIVIGPSNFVIEFHKKHNFFKKSLPKVIPNFIDFNGCFVSQEEVKATFDILFVGRLSEVKGVDILIKAFKELKEEFLRLHIVGDGKARKYLENLSADDKRVIFYGKRPISEIKKIYSFCDVLVIPSIWYENFPTVVMEAFYFGVPVIGSEIGGIPEQIINEHNGFLFTPGNHIELKQKLSMLIESFKSDRKLIKRLKENAFKSGHKYTKDKILKNIEDMYHLVCSG